MKITYSYKDLPDKTKAGMEKELKKGLVITANYFSTTFGLPLELFNELSNEKLPNQAAQWIFYLNFRNSHPKLFN